MNIASIVVLAIGYSIIWIIFFRVPKNRKSIILIVLLLPMIFFTVRWANYRDTWMELLLALFSSALITVIWWLIIGRVLKAPRDSEIRVWSKDDPFE